MPIVNSKDEVVRLFTRKDSKISHDFPRASNDKMGRLLVGAAVNVGKNAEKSVDMLVKAGVDVLVIEENDDFEAELALIKWVKEKHPQIEVIAGNVDTEEQAKFFIETGADALRVLIGFESTCIILFSIAVNYSIMIVFQVSLKISKP